jgi:hypothetical protein
MQEKTYACNSSKRTANLMHAKYTRIRFLSAHVRHARVGCESNFKVVAYVVFQDFTFRNTCQICVHARMLCSVGSHLLCQLEKRKRAMSFKLIVICNNLYMACNVKCQCKYDQFRHDFSEEGWICDTQYFAYAVYLMCINLLLELLNDDLVIVG